MPSGDAARRARAASSPRRSATGSRRRRSRRAQGRLARYTWDDAYAELREQLDALGRRLGGAYRVLVDANQHVDREAAARSGVGFYGKNTMLITRRHGSWVVLGTLVTDVELEATPPLDADCGECRLCIDACPTGALDEPGTLDATKCLSYWTQAPGAGAGGVPRGARRTGLRLRHLPGRLPVEPRRREAARGARRPRGRARRSRRVARGGRRALVGDYDRLYVPRNDPRWLRRNALVALGNIGGRGARAGARALRGRTTTRCSREQLRGRSRGSGARVTRAPAFARVVDRARPARRGAVRGAAGRADRRATRRGTSVGVGADRRSRVGAVVLFASAASARGAPLFGVVAMAFDFSIISGVRRAVRVRAGDADAAAAADRASSPGRSASGCGAAS